MHKSSIFIPIKKRIVIIGIAIILILICFVLLQRQSSRIEDNNKIIIDMLEKQSMLTQLMSKDANSLYTVLQAKTSGEPYESEEDLNQRKYLSIINLKSEKDDFLQTLSGINRGYLQKGTKQYNIGNVTKSAESTIFTVNEIWEKYEAALDIIINADRISASTTEAMNYINSINLLFFRLCENITEIVLSESMENTKRIEYWFYGMIILFMLIILGTVFNLINYILIPFQQLYKGINKIGLAKTATNKFSVRKKTTIAEEEIHLMFQKIDNLISLIQNINNNSSFMETLNYINCTFSEYIPYNYIGIALLDEDKKALKASYGVSSGTIVGLPENVIGITVALDDTSLGNMFKSGEARIINDLEEYTANKPLSLYNKIILEAGIRSSITLPLMVSGRPVGIIFFSSQKKNVYTQDHMNFLKTLVDSIAISFNQNIFINDLLYSDIIALAKLAEARDEETGEHLERMKLYSRAVVEILYEYKMFQEEVTTEYIDQIERFSPLHDIGKVGISDKILLKPGKLTAEEFDEMKRHTTYGAEVLEAAESNIRKIGKSLFVLGIEISESHHEKWDGSGYPLGKKKEEIPLSARIVAVADVFDALTSRRPYKEPFSLKESLKIIAEGSGNHFDPEIIRVVLERKEKLVEIYDRFHHD